MPAISASSSSPATVTTSLVRIGFWLNAPSTIGRSGVAIAGRGAPNASGTSGSQTTWNGSRCAVPRSTGCRVRTLIRATASLPRGTSSTGGFTRNPSAWSGSETFTRSRAAEFPQLETFTVCRPLHRPDEVTGVSVACSPATEPTSRSPSATALSAGSTWDLARTPNGSVPPGAPGPEGGANVTTADSSCWG
jgi:hypothetical protein